MKDFEKEKNDNLSVPEITENNLEVILAEQAPSLQEVPILPLRNTVLFPGVVVPISAGREPSAKLLKEAKNADGIIGVIAQKDEKTQTPAPEDLFSVGTIARILRIVKLPDGNTMAFVQGTERFHIQEFTQKKPYLKATVEIIPEPQEAQDDQEFIAAIGSVKELAKKIIRENNNIPSEASGVIDSMNSGANLVNFILSNIGVSVQEKQEVLETDLLTDRALLAIKFMDAELKRISLQNKIQSKTRSDLEKQQREYFLHQQMKAIQEELGGESYEQEVERLRQSAKQKKWDKKTEEHFLKELGKMQRLNPQSPDYSVQSNYLNLMLELPWNEFSKDKFDLKKAQKILDKDHYGLEDVKRRMIEYLAVLKLRNDMKSPIICLYGPPGVGKTSLGRSIAKALGREYARMSLGGLRDEAEIRGHRKTYIGAMPGRILQLLKKVGKSNPVFILDEIDKLSVGYSGDPSSALLEVLDPEQNNDFYDNFLEIGYDLSKVMFIATANDLSTIQPALLDRMEIINVTGYTIEEKVEIAKRHLLPKQLKEHGLAPDSISLGKKEIEQIIDGYTRESGVRGLEKQIAKLVRYVAKMEAMEEPYEPKISSEDIVKILGPARLDRSKYEDNDVAGIVTGLAWTSVGGDILFIESSLSKGKGNLSITGNLGKVMKESATIALEYIKANAQDFGIDENIFQKYDVHIHVPEGATPKDGPSAGITMLTSLVSLFTQKRVKKNLAMTGEITLRGKVLPVGGIKEKILAAKRAGIKEIILCEENRKDIQEIKESYINGLTFHYVTDMKEVIDIAITQQPVKHPKKLLA